jgi:hypothetical protein
VGRVWSLGGNSSDGVTTPEVALGAFENDRDRDADHLNAGFRTLRITDHRLKHHPTKEAQRLNSILSPSGTEPPHAA